jgi:hypothetical protein
MGNKMKGVNLKELTGMELLIFQSEVMSRTPAANELQEQIYEELKKRRRQIEEVKEEVIKKGGEKNNVL